MAALSDKLKTTLSGYAGKMLNGYAYLTTNEDESVFTVVAVGLIGEKRIVETSLIVRAVGDKIVIEHDDNDKPLVEALLQVGVPREQIVLAYHGEPVPEAA